MFQFFVDESQIVDKTVRIAGKDVNHIKNVLRMKIGEELNVLTPDSDKEYRCAVREYTDEEVICELLFIKENNTELDADITLYQGLPKADKMELIIQKAVELGAARIVPVAMDRSVVKLLKDKADKKITRWNMISEAAAKQSKRRFVPRVTQVMTFTEALLDAESAEIKILPYELCDMDSMQKTKEIIASIKAGSKIAIFIGPEGGFSDSEIDNAAVHGVKTVTLGHRILRTETAGMLVLSWLVMQLEK